MGVLRYAEHEFTVDDDALFHLDVILSECHTKGLSFQFHLTLGGQHDYDLISIALGPHTPTVMKYANHERTVDVDLVVAAMNRVHQSGMLSIEHVTTRTK